MLLNQSLHGPSGLHGPLQYLDNEGHPFRETPAFAADKDTLLDAYRWMSMTRAFDQKAIALQRTGKIGTYPSSLGQEAISVAIGLAMQKDDVFVPYYRDHGTLLVRGHDISDLLLYWGGDERGSTSGPAQDMPLCVPIATQASHAVGIASAMKIRKQNQAVLCTLGDGASSKGDFLEALNLAGTWHLPVVFVINNNQWAISVPRHYQSGAPTLAQKGVGAAVPGVQVDGNDYLAMYDAVDEALTRARQRKGPSLIEAISYRLSDHTTADDASRYREQQEVDDAWLKEPVKRLRGFIHAQGWWDEREEMKWQDHCQTHLIKAVERYIETPPEMAEAMFDHMYAEWPQAMDDQLALCADKVKRNGGAS